MSMIRTIRFVAIVFAIACATDTSAPLGDFKYAAAAAQCGPADGPAVAIYLSPSPIGALEPNAPYVRVYVAVQVGQLTAQAWPISGNSDAAAWFHLDDSNSEPAESGLMIVKSVDADNTITGTVDLQFPAAGHISHDFTARWLPQQALCV